MKNIKRLLLALLLLPAVVCAKGIYLTHEQFIAGAFGDDKPITSRIWMSDEVNAVYRKLFSRDPDRLRLTYWHLDHRSAWILEAIGKERPITAGFVIESDRIIKARVLAFRESRGWEIRLPAFTAQFNGTTIDQASRFNRVINGISGATLSVRAMEKMAQFALFLHSQSMAVRYDAS